MIVADCCYCDADMSYLLPEGVRLPAMRVERCSACKRGNVFRVSRVGPMGWTLEAGLAEYASDPEAVEYIQRSARVLNCVNADQPIG